MSQTTCFGTKSFCVVKKCAVHWLTDKWENKLVYFRLETLHLWLSEKLHIRNTHIPTQMKTPKWNIISVCVIKSRLIVLHTGGGKYHKYYTPDKCQEARFLVGKFLSQFHQFMFSVEKKTKNFNNDASSHIILPLTFPSEGRATLPSRIIRTIQLHREMFIQHLNSKQHWTLILYKLFSPAPPPLTLSLFVCFSTCVSNCTNCAPRVCSLEYKLLLRDWTFKLVGEPLFWQHSWEL